MKISPPSNCSYFMGEDDLKQWVGCPCTISSLFQCLYPAPQLLGGSGAPPVHDSGSLHAVLLCVGFVRGRSLCAWHSGALSV